jgi:hypothetical protein
VPRFAAATSWAIGQKVGPYLKDGILLDDSKCKSEMTGGKMSLTKEGIAIRQAPPGVESADELPRRSGAS